MILSLAAGEVSEESLTRWIRDNWPADRVPQTNEADVPLVHKRPAAVALRAGFAVFPRREPNTDRGYRWQSITKWPTRPLTATIISAHEQTYEGFIKLVKYGTAAVIFIVAMMAIFLT